MTGYIVLLAFAIALNMRDWRMLSLSCVVGAGIFMPIPDDGFYLICALVECCVVLLTVQLAANASRVIVRVSALLIIFHALGWLFNGYPPESPYHIMVRICEHAELIACIALSRPINKMVTYA